MDMIEVIEKEQESIINEMAKVDRISQEYMVLMQRLVDITESKRDEAEFKRSEAEAKYFETQENAIKEQAEEFIKKVAERLDKVEHQLNEVILKDVMKDTEDEEDDQKVVRMIGFR